MTSTSPTPDLSTLSLNAQPSQRPHDSYDYDGLTGVNLRQQYHFSTTPMVAGQMPYSPLDVSQSSPLKAKSSRAGLPTVRSSETLSLSSLFWYSVYTHVFLLFLKQWMDTQAAVADPRSMSPPTNSDLSSGGSPPMAHVAAPLQPTTPGQIGDDEIIPTAIVIKNIPFNVKRETLLDIIVSPFHFVSMALTLFLSCVASPHCLR